MSASWGEWLPWVQALGWTLLHFIWQGLVVGIGYAALRALLPKANCNARYAAGLGALGLLTLWPLATFIALRPQATEGLAAQAFATADAGAAAIVATPAASALAPIDQLLPVLVLLWTAGVLFVALRSLRQWRALSRVAREWATSSDDLDAMLASLSRRFRFVRRIRVLVTERIDTPMLIGWIKPVVLLPAAVALGFPRQQVELILAHELGHLRRYDHLVNLGQALLETLLFYHPVVHWISREVRNERELCCDALVLRLTTGEPREYARTLAALEELRQPSVQVALAANGGVLLERVRRIVGMPAPRLRVARPHAARWMLIATLLAVAVSMTLRVERAGESRYVGALTVDWLTQPDVRILPIAALTVPFERPRLRLAEIAPPVVERPLVERPVADNAVIAPPPANVDTRPAELTSPVVAAAKTDATHSVPVASQAVASIGAAGAAPKVMASVSPGEALLGASASAKAPVAVRIVSPTFPSTWRSEDGQVDASFQIAADGSLRDIRIADNGAGAAFVRAAERALEQWRFDPHSLSGDRSARFRQSFVFAASVHGSAGNRSENSCVTSTGSLICRPIEDAAPVTTISMDSHR